MVHAILSANRVVANRVVANRVVANRENDILDQGSAQAKKTVSFSLGVSSGAKIDHSKIFQNYPMQLKMEEFLSRRIFE